MAQTFYEGEVRVMELALVADDDVEVTVEDDVGEKFVFVEKHPTVLTIGERLTLTIARKE